jgi:hypothetical protein
MDQVNKQKTADVRRAINGIRKRQQAVATAPTDNGVSALSAELQEALDPLVTPTLLDLGATTVNATTIITVPKRRRMAAVATAVGPKRTIVPTGPVETKCQGCVHGDLLEMKVMEPVHIKYYLKQAGFLEWATCAECNHTVREIHLASPRALLHYCDEIIKGFSAPDHDLAKASLQCGLILCSPCHAVREIRYAQEQATTGTEHRRTSRRGTNRF